MVRSGAIDGLVFHGDTALRLCYGVARLSEDLKFCGGIGFRPDRLTEMAAAVERHIRQRKGLQVRVKEPSKQTLDGVGVHRWWIQAETEPSHPDLPWQNIKLEIATVPSRRQAARSLVMNHDVLPTECNDIVVRVSTMEGIQVDKIIAFPAALPAYVRWRDIRDMHWLSKRVGGVGPELVRALGEDHGLKGFGSLLAPAIGVLTRLVHSGGLVRVL